MHLFFCRYVTSKRGKFAFAVGKESRGWRPVDWKLSRFAGVSSCTAGAENKIRIARGLKFSATKSSVELLCYVWRCRRVDAVGEWRAVECRRKKDGGIDGNGYKCGSLRFRNLPNFMETYGHLCFLFAGAFPAEENVGNVLLEVIRRWE